MGSFPLPFQPRAVDGSASGPSASEADAAPAATPRETAPRAPAMSPGPAAEPASEHAQVPEPTSVLAETPVGAPDAVKTIDSGAPPPPVRAEAAPVVVPEPAQCTDPVVAEAPPVVGSEPAKWT